MIDIADYRFLTVVNQSGEEIPAYAVMEVTEVDLDGSIYVNKPSADSTKLIIINGQSSIPIEGDGAGTIDMPFWILFDDADGTPATNQRWGPANGSWKLRKGKQGFLTIAMKNGISPPVPGVVFAKLEECRT